MNGGAKLLALIVLSTGLGITGDIFLKTARELLSIRFLIGFLLYAAAAVPVWTLYRLQSFVSISIAWQAVSLALALMVGVFFFKEHLTTRQIAALSFTVAAIALLQTEP